MLVHDLHLAARDDVVLVVAEQLLGLDRVVEESDQRGVLGLVQVVDAEPVLDLLDARFEHTHRALLLVHLVVGFRGERLHHGRELAVPAVGLPRGRAGDDERGAGLVDEDGVHLVHDREVVAPLDELVLGPRHVVAQVVEAELVVGAVGDVRGVLLAAHRGFLTTQDHPGLQAQETVDAAHEVGLVLGQVVVDGHHVHALARERVEVRRGRGHQGLALTGLHLRDVAEVQCRTAHDLHVEVALAQGPGRRLAHSGERLRQQPVERLAVRDALPERVRLCPQLRVREFLEPVLEAVHGVRVRPQSLQDALVARAENRFQE